MQTFKVKWCDVTEYETTVEADSIEEARAKFYAGDHGSLEPTGWTEMEADSLEVTEE